MQGTVIIDNRTGHPVRAYDCLSPFQVILFNETYRPSPAWLSCLQIFIIPVGESNYPVTVNASYLGCGEHGPGGGLPGCLNGAPPPLPPGTYRARFFQSSRIVPAQPAITIRVTAPSRLPRPSPPRRTCGLGPCRPPVAGEPARARSGA